jgi:hypothetical protein
MVEDIAEMCQFGLLQHFEEGETVMTSWRSRILALATVLILLTGIFVPMKALAEGANGLVFAEFRVDIRPEYDHDFPHILVIYWPTVVNKGATPYDGEIIFRAPKGVDLGNACELNEKGDHFAQPQKVTQKDDYQEIRMKLSKPLEPNQSRPLHFEYYWNGILKEGDLKKLQVSYSPDIPIEKMVWDVFQPSRSSNFQTDLTEVSSAQTSDGLTVRHYESGAVAVGETKSLNISYNRPEDKASVKAATSSGSGGGLKVSGVNTTTTIVLIGLLGIFGFLLFFGISGPKSSSRRTPPSAPKGGKGYKAPAQPAPKAVATKATPAKPVPAASPDDERRQARQALLDGRISEETYKEIIRDLDRRK